MTEPQPLTTSARFSLLQKSVAETKRLAGILALVAFGLGACSVLSILDGTIGTPALLLIALTAIVFLSMLAVLVTAAVTGFLLDLAIVQHEHRP